MKGKFKPNWEYAGRYSDDRLSILQEIRDLLVSKGQWVPYDWACSDILQAIALVLQKIDGLK